MTLEGYTKRLSKIGNSYGLIIDKHLMKAANIGPHAPVRISYDGKRLIIERERGGHDPELAAKMAFVLRRDSFLEAASGLDDLSREEVHRLCGERTFMRSLASRLERSVRASSHDDQLMLRVEHVWAARVSGLTNDAAISRALELVPDAEPY